MAEPRREGHLPRWRLDPLQYGERLATRVSRTFANSGLLRIRCPQAKHVAIERGEIRSLSSGSDPRLTAALERKAFLHYFSRCHERKDCPP
jgi:hypothetical protein